MRVVLREDIEKLGRRGEVVKVADGFARNFLLPKGKALPASAGNLKRIEQEKRRYTIKVAREREEMEAVARRIEGISLTLVRKVGEHDVLYGSVTAADIAESLEKEGVSIDRRRIQLPEPIKSLGIYNVPVKLHPEVKGEIKVWVVKE
jgi:large subunit ribosomal protein L9